MGALRIRASSALVVCLFGSLLLAHCGTASGGGASDGTPGSARDGGGPIFGGGGPSGSSADGGSSTYGCPGCPKFPPVGTPECAPTVLPAPKLAYPLDGMLLPPNMNVLEVQFEPSPGAKVYEVDFMNAVTSVKVESTCNAVPDVRGGASRGCGVTLPQGAWDDVANRNRDGDPVKVIVRATTDGSCVATSTAKVNLSFAKENLAGGIYYWQSATFGGVGGKTGGIYSHDFGSFSPTATPFYTSGGTGTCVGCHNLSRDGAVMALATDDPDGDDEFADVHTHLMDVAARNVIGGSTMSPGFQTFTHDHAKMIGSTFKTTGGGGKGGGPGGGGPGGGGAVDQAFAVFDTTNAALLTTMALPSGMQATQPDLSKDDASLVFVVPAAGTISTAGDHHFKLGALYTSKFTPAANTLGAPQRILGAAGHNYYYPSFSPDGAFLVLNDAPDAADTPTSNGDAFYNRNARVKLLHNPAAAGAQPIDLAALNVADGLTNSGPRWSPFVTTFHGHSILWVTFSSNRDYGLHLANKGFDNCYPPEGPAYDQPAPLSKQGVTYANCAQPQIWMAAVIVNPSTELDASDRSFPAFWLPFQDVTAHNHSAQWVEKVQAPPSGGSDGGSCGGNGASCGSGPPCCSDTVCCGNTCVYSCIK